MTYLSNVTLISSLTSPQAYIHLHVLVKYSYKFYPLPFMARHYC